MRLSLIHLFVTSVLIPWLCIYLFFLTYGFWLADPRVRFSIESVFFHPKGALLASLLGVLSVILFTFPTAFILRIYIFSKLYKRTLLYVFGASTGIALGVLVNQDTFYGEMFYELSLLGIIEGSAVAFTSDYFLGKRVPE